jgi:hypothetical protein
MAQSTRDPRVWVLFRQHDRVSQGADDPGLDLEGFPTIKAATTAIGRRFGVRQGDTAYLHPDRVQEDGYQEWPDLDKSTAHAEVWLRVNYPDQPPGWQPDATSQPCERWTPHGLLGVTRHPS